MRTMERMYDSYITDNGMALVGDHIGRKMAQVVTIVTHHSAAVILVSQVCQRIKDPFLSILTLAMKQASNKIKAVAKLMDKLNEDNVIDSARKEGGEADQTVQDQFWEAAEEIVTETGTYTAGVAEYNL